MTTTVEPSARAGVVRSAADLAALRSGRIRVPHGVLRLELPGLSEEEARTLGIKLTLLRHECGCSIGALVAYPTLVAVAAWQVVHPPAWADRLLTRVGVTAGLVVLAGAIGKGIGIVRARVRLRREVDALVRRLAL